MLYIEKGAPLNSIAQKTAEIKRRDAWKALPLNAPEDEREAHRYTDALRIMFDEFSKDDIRSTVLKEQHHLCVYCMRRIKIDPLTTKIEHWYPLSQNKEKAIEYTNFFGACTGVDSQNNTTQPCCDTSKSGTIIKLNPCDRRMMNQIKYESDGTIYFDSADGWTKEEVDDFNDEIKKVLRLNGDIPENDYLPGSELRSRRAAVYAACKNTITRMVMRNPRHTVSISDIQALIDNIESKEEYPEYAGVMLFYYKRWISNHTR